jgi:hypothetical protein
MKNSTSRRELFASVFRHATPKTESSPYQTQLRSIQDRQGLLDIVFKPKDNSQWRVIDGNVVVFYQGETLFSEKLSMIQRFIFRQMDGKTSLDELCRRASRALKETESTVHREAFACIKLATDRGVIESR